MSLPTDLSTIFRNKQKSYKMVLLISMIDLWRQDNIQNLAIDQVAELFQSYYIHREESGLQSDHSPHHLAQRWGDIRLTQVKSLLETPISALLSVIKKTDDGASLTFHDHIWAMGSEVIDELYQLATRELEQYNAQLPSLEQSQSVEALPNIWWVNQNATLKQELQEGILWAPLRNVQNKPTYHWETMKDVRPGDIVLHYANKAIRYISRVTEQAVTAPKPASMERSTWEQEGRLVKTDYYPLEPAILLERFNQGLQQLPLPKGPITSSGGVNQGYLYCFTIEALQHIQRSAPEVNWPEFSRFNPEEASTLDTQTVPERIAHIKSYIQQRGFAYPNGLIENFYLSLKTKPFVILAGVSGTGKTKLIKLFAEAIGATKDNGQFTLIPVRPDWSDPSDLIGYKDLSGTFRPGRLTEVLCEAAQPHNQHKPYFICLDEMNLARVEHYFSDMLSLLETQEWKNGRIVTAPLIHRSSLTTEEDQNRYGDLSIPDNVYLIGTVNMDETTHPFSKKVLDRAHTIEFNNINLVQFPEDSVELITPVAAPNDFLRSEYLQLVDAYATSKDLIQSTTETLVKLNETLEDIHAHVGFRIRDAMCFYMIYSQRDQLLSKDEAFDLQLLQKILPRIQGSSSSVKRALLKLFQQCVTTSIPIEEFMDGADSQSKLKAALSQAKYPQSGRKLAFMLRRLEEDGFTSYWLS